MLDLGTILTRFQKWGGKDLNSRKAKHALEFMENKKMLDLGTIGPKFTWSKKRKGLAHIKQRLEKAKGNIEW